MAAFTLANYLFTGASVLLTSGALLFLAIVFFFHYQHCKYAHIPSPPRQGFFVGHINLVYGYIKKNMTFSEYFVDTMKEYGPVFLLFFYFNPLVVVLEPNFVKEVLTNNKHKKPYAVYRIFEKIFGARFTGSSIITEISPEIHASKRALLNPAFHKKYLQSLMNQFNASADLLIEKLRHKADGRTEVAMLDEMNRATMDVISKVAFGLDLNVTVDEEAPFNHAISTCLYGMTVAARSPMTEFSPLPAARKIKDRVRKSIAFLRETGRKCIEQRMQGIRRGEEVPKDILTHILKEVDESKSDGLNMGMEDLIDEFMLFFGAGQETTANLLSFTLLELGHHPEIMHRLRTEVEAVFGDKEYLEYADIIKLNYMMQVFKEVLRLWPPVVGTTRELACDITVKGYKIPKGTVVMVNSYVMARMEEYFHDPLEFDPDRFKASDDKPHYTYFPFSLGSRNCIGQQFALIEARVLLAKLLHSFNFDLVPGQGHEVLDEMTIKPLGRCRNYIRLVQ